MTTTRTPGTRRVLLVNLFLLLISLLASGCSGKPEEPKAAQSAPIQAPAPAEAADEAIPPPAYEMDLPEAVRAELGQSYKGDLDGMLKRRMIRAGVTYNRTHYFIDKGVQRGALYEYGKAFEDELNKKHRTGNLKTNVVFMPMPREQLAAALLDGKVDMLMAQITVTPERQKLVDFTIPTRKDVNEIVVSAPGAAPIDSIDDLAGRQVFVRKGGIYYESLQALNEKFKAAGKPLIDIQDAPQNLEDEDLLEMVNAGLMENTVVDDYLAKFWSKVFTNLNVHDTVAVRTGGTLAVAVRKNSPQLLAALNDFIRRNGIGSTFGNMLQKRYLESTKFVKDATSEAERKKLLATADLFRKYSDQYGIDYLLMAAQGYQESGLDQSVKSPVGAIGVMQLMPATGAELKVGDVRQIEPNIHAGVKYIRFLIDEYYKDEPMDSLNKGLFAFASYNAGPGRIRQLRREAAQRGLDPNVWFGNVEQIASERIGRETVTYVSNIYKYYVAYKLVMAERARRETAKQSIRSAQDKPKP